MHSTVPEEHTTIIMKRVRQYSKRDTRIYNSVYSDKSWTLGGILKNLNFIKWNAGEGFLASVPDLAIFGNSFLTKKLLSENTIRNLMWKNTKLESGEITKFGVGSEIYQSIFYFNL